MVNFLLKLEKIIIRRKGRLSIHGDLEKIPMIIALLIVQIRGHLL